MYLEFTLHTNDEYVLVCVARPRSPLLLNYVGAVDAAVVLLLVLLVVVTRT